MDGQQTIRLEKRVLGSVHSASPPADEERHSCLEPAGGAELGNPVITE